MVLAWVWECTPVTSALGLGEEDQELRAASPKAAPSSCCSQQALHQNSNARSGLGLRDSRGVRGSIPTAGDYF